MAQYTNGAFSFTTVGSTTIRYSAMNLRAGTNVSADDSELVYPESMSLVGLAPEAEITTKAVEEVLGNISLSGECVGAAFTVTQVDMYARKLATCQAALGATPHMRWRSAAGLLRLQTLTASRGQDAEISFAYDALSVAGASPLTITDGVAIPATTGGRFRLGVCKLGGVTFAELEQVSISYNISITSKEPELGGVYPEAVGVLTVEPVLTLTGRDLSQIKSGAIEFGAEAGTHLTTIIQLKKLEDSASYYADGASEHIKLTLDGLIVPEDLANVSAGGRGTNTIRMLARHDGTNSPIVATLDTTYTDTP